MSVLLLRLRLHKQKRSNPASTRNTTPPTIPPIIAPIGGPLEVDPLDTVGETVLFLITHVLLAPMVGSSGVMGIVVVKVTSDVLVKTTPSDRVVEERIVDVDVTTVSDGGAEACWRILNPSDEIIDEIRLVIPLTLYLSAEVLALLFRDYLRLLC